MSSDKTRYVVRWSYDFTEGDERFHDSGEVSFRSLDRAAKWTVTQRAANIESKFGWFAEVATANIFAVRDGLERLVATFQPYRGTEAEWFPHLSPAVTKRSWNA